MRTIELVLVSEHGDIVATTPLSGFQVAEAGEVERTTERPEQPVMAQVSSAIGDALRHERVEAMVDDIDIQMLVGTSLLAPEDGPTVAIRLPIRALPERSVPEQRAGGSATTADPIRFLDELFDLDTPVDAASALASSEGGEDAAI